MKRVNNYNKNGENIEGSLTGWYYGYLNAVPDSLPLPDSHVSEIQNINIICLYLFMQIFYLFSQRYGLAGALRMQARAMNMMGLSEPLLEDWQKRDWAPKLEGTPHLWPADADYVTGCILKPQESFPKPVSSLSINFFLLNMTLQKFVTVCTVASRT